MEKEKLDVELFRSQTEPLGVDSIDFVMDNATFIRIQVIVRGLVKVLPNDLIDDIAALVRNYDMTKITKNGPRNATTN